MFTAVLVTIAKKGKLKWWMDKYLYNELLFSHKRNEILTHATTCINFKNSKRNQLEGNTCCMISFIGNVHNRQNPETENKLVVP